MQKMVVLRTFLVFFQLCILSYCGIDNWIDIRYIGWMEFWFVCFQIWICVSVILLYVILEWKFDQKLKIEKMAVKGGFIVALNICGTFGIQNWLATLYTDPHTHTHKIIHAQTFWWEGTLAKDSLITDGKLFRSALTVTGGFTLCYLHQLYSPCEMSFTHEDHLAMISHVHPWVTFLLSSLKTGHTAKCPKEKYKLSELAFSVFNIWVLHQYKLM